MGTHRPIKFESPGLGPLFIKSPPSESNLQSEFEIVVRKYLKFSFHEVVS